MRTFNARVRSTMRSGCLPRPHRCQNQRSSNMLEGVRNLFFVCWKPQVAGAKSSSKVQTQPWKEIFNTMTKSRVSSSHQNLNRPSLLHNKGDVWESVIYQVWEVIEKGSLPPPRVETEGFPLLEGGLPSFLALKRTWMREEGSALLLV